MSDRLRDRVYDAMDNIDPRITFGSLSIDGLTEATNEIMERVVTPLLDTLLYLELHIDRYTWNQLTTDQKNLLADLIDEHRGAEFDDYEPMERWWV